MDNAPKPTCFYQVFVRYGVKREGTQEYEFVGRLKTFNDHPNNPILDREAAFDYREMIADILLENVNIDSKELSEFAKRTLLDKHFFFYKTESIVSEEDDEFAYILRKDDPLSFVHDGKEDAFSLPDDSMAWYNRFREGLFVIMNHNDEAYFNEDEGDLMRGHRQLIVDKITGRNGENIFTPPNLQHLEEEYEFYQKHHYSIIGNKGNYESTVNFFDDEEFYEGDSNKALAAHTILKTPFDWTGYDQPFWWGEPSSQFDWEWLDEVKKEEEWKKKLPPWKEIWDTLGENHFKEFKPALIYNFNKGKGGINPMYHVAKSIAAFLNANGGYLFIGITDSGGIQGLEYDYSLAEAEGKSPHDFVQLKLGLILNTFLPKFVSSLVRVKFPEIEGTEFLLIETQPSPEPVFLTPYKRPNDSSPIEKEFFVRKFSSSERIIDPEEIVKYCKVRWWSS